MRTLHQILPLLCLSTLLSAKPAELSVEVPQRLLQQEVPFEAAYTPEVAEAISRYLGRGRRATEHMLGRAEHLLPLFEHYLKKHGAPDALKYLPLLESRLRPQAHSPAGAAGYWQFMPATARGFGLEVGAEIDERLDPFYATETAVRYLVRLHQQFGDWGLALAAYNCGPGRVRRALRQSGCTDYWSIQHLLPRQTRLYIPRLIATIYIGEHYREHGLQPNARQQQPVKAFRVLLGLDLEAIAQACKLSTENLLALNPSLKTTWLPAREKPYHLVLPAAAVPGFQDYIQKKARTARPDAVMAAQFTAWQPAEG